MNLNPDCVRDVLLAIEELIDDEDAEILFPSDSVEISSLSSYSAKDVRYSISQCKKQGLIETGEEFIDRTLPVTGLTPEGHRFLESIRPSARWRRILSAAVKDLRSSVLGELVDLASEYARSDHPE